MTKQHQIFHTNVLQTSTNIHNKIQLLFGPFAQRQTTFFCHFCQAFSKVTPKLKQGFYHIFKKKRQNLGH